MMLRIDRFRVNEMLNGRLQVGQENGIPKLYNR